MLKRVVTQGPTGESMRPLFGPSSCSQGVYHMTSDMPGDERLVGGGSEPYDQRYEMSGSLNHMTSDR